MRRVFEMVFPSSIVIKIIVTNCTYLKGIGKYHIFIFVQDNNAL